MKITVPCKITFSAEDKCWYVEAPGFYSGILTDGGSLEEAKEMASEAVSGIIASYLKHGERFSIPAMPESPGFYEITALSMAPVPKTPVPQLAISNE
jgi:predicted RNase H-like HicB family nuclease